MENRWGHLYILPDVCVKVNISSLMWAIVQGVVIIKSCQLSKLFHRYMFVATSWGIVNQGFWTSHLNKNREM